MVSSVCKAQPITSKLEIDNYNKFPTAGIFVFLCMMFRPYVYFMQSYCELLWSGKEFTGFFYFQIFSWLYSGWIN